jgi:VWFA-related protein
MEIRLDDALLRVAFLSGGTSVTVPTLLLSNIYPSGLLHSLDQLQLNGVETISGRKTFRIEGKINGETMKLWIDQSNFLILKTFRSVRSSAIDEEVTVKYKPAVNIEIAAERLAFKPPPAEVSKQLPRSAIADTSSPPNLKSFGQSLRMNSAEIERLRNRKRNSTSEEDVVRVDTDLVVSEVLVIDRNGNSVSGLLPKDFSVKEDDQLQVISSFSVGNTGTVQRSIALILDYSGSELPYIGTSVEAAKMLVDKLSPNDRMAIVSDDVNLLVDFTSDKELLKTSLESLRSKALSGKTGRSAQYDALMATLSELFSEEDVRPIVIFQTDGDQLGSLKGEVSPNPNPYALPKRFGLPELKTAAEKARATIYSIIPGVRFVGVSEEERMKRAAFYWESSQKSWAEVSPQNNGGSNSKRATPSKEILKLSSSEWLRRQLALTDLAGFTGGWADYLEQPDQAHDVYTRVLANMNMRYVIGYYPTNKARDGKRRQVTIEVRDHPEYIVWGRKAYFAPQPE